MWPISLLLALSRQINEEEGTTDNPSDAGGGAPSHAASTSRDRHVSRIPLVTQYNSHRCLLMRVASEFGAIHVPSPF
jgi:hypothetical protein